MQKNVNQCLTLLVLLVAVSLSGCQTTHVSKVSDKYSGGDEGQVVANIFGNARQRGGKLSKKEQDLLQIVGHIRLNQFLEGMTNSLKFSETRGEAIKNIKGLKEKAFELNGRLASLLQEYQSKESEISQAYEVTHRESCARVTNEILDQINNGNSDKAENTWLVFNDDLDRDQRASIVSALSRKHAESLTKNTYEAVLLGGVFLANETVKLELPKEQHAELLQHLTKATLAQPDGDRSDAFRKLELLGSIQKMHNTELNEASKLEIAASISDLQNKFVIKMHPVETFNRSGQSIRDFSTALADCLRSKFSSLSPCYTRVEKLPEEISIQALGDTSFETLNECLKSLKPIPNSNRRLILLTEVKSVRVEKEPKDRETVRIERTTSDMSFLEAFSIGATSGGGKFSHYEYDKESQKAEVTVTLEIVLCDLATGKILLRDTIDPGREFSSIQVSNLMAVGQDTVNGKPTGPLKKAQARNNPPSHVQQAMSQSTGPLPSNSAMTKQVFQLSASMISDLVETYFLKTGGN